MGTSSSFGGASGRNPLLPPWAQGDELMTPGSTPDPDTVSPLVNPPLGVPEGGESPPPEVPPPTLTSSTAAIPAFSWAAAKRGMTAYTSRGDRGSLRNAANRYVGARGGGQTAARSAQAGRSSTARMGGFLAGVSSRGFEAVARELGLSACLGRGIDQLLTAIANALAPDGATQEDSVARQAVNETLGYLYERYSLADGDLTKLDAMDRAGVRDALAVSVTGYIYLRWVQELGKKIEENAVTAREAVRLERDVKAFIAETVQLDMTGVDPVTLDWGGPVGQRFVEQIYANAYEMLEGE